MENEQLLVVYHVLCDVDGTLAGGGGSSSRNRSTTGPIQQLASVAPDPSTAGIPGTVAAGRNRHRLTSKTAIRDTQP